GSHNMAEMVETVCGPVPVEQLGKTLIHEHFLFGYPGFQGDVTRGTFREDESLRVAVEAAEKMKRHGIQTVVDPTPNDCGRNPAFLRRVAEETGLNIICATGYYYNGEGAPPYFQFRRLLGTAEDDIYDMFMAELTEGIADTGIKAGVIKLASSKGRITEYEKMFFRAAARAQKETGAVIITHTQEGTMGPEQAAYLLEHGADPKKIVIGHMCGNTDPDYHRKTLAYGVYIAFDRFGIQGMVGAPTDEERVRTLLALLRDGYEKQIMLSHDTVNVWLGRPFTLPEPFAEMMKNWHVEHLFVNIIPALKNEGIRDEVLEQMFIGNPAALFSA
uniref:Phosphotriesterase n=1 Tax=Geobacillus kaustophilus (strain HTA426) TaxID=235909 RepID=UPI00029722C7